ncbi:MAG: multicopper oxidase domain-containing protein [Alphaproteobacteria bacterium]
MSLRPKECRVYRFRPDRPGAHLILSHGAPAGGEGDGGQLTHGLFGVVVVERAGSRWYRSQVTSEVMAAARANVGTGGFLNYEAMQNGVPLLAMARQTSAARQPLELELIHGDLNSISYCPLEERRNPEANRTDHPEHARIARHCANAAMREAAGGGLVSGEWWRANPAHRSFSVVFHDELHTRYAPPFRNLDEKYQRSIQAHYGQKQGAMLDGVRDGFAINYGASGMGTILLANRLGTGPSASCVECAYEEFFLGSWANGDPALLTDEVRQLYNTTTWNDALPREARGLLNQDVLRGARFYKDDPSNTHHSYIGDRVVFHNLHAGPKETHVFHLHAHQWRAGSGGQGAYRDSQTIAPLQAITYEIDHGGGGNLNLGPGDSIFHCHLYPHFAQGMWGLWRNHDVFEDGSRTLPDGIYGPGTDPTNGNARTGAPIPAVVPLPGQAMPPAPIYSANEAEQMPGFPFFIPGETGRRAPQPPMDRASDDQSGLPRHVAKGQGQRHPIGRAPEASPLAEVARVIAEVDFRFEISELALHILPENGTARESRAMQFHAGQGSVDSPVRTAPSATPVAARRSDRIPGIGQVAFFALPTPDGSTPLAGPSGLPSGVAPFRVNGRDPAPGAPFADPCVRVDDFATPDREYRVSVIKLEMVVNEQGWHDPQAHINVLTELAPDIEGRRRRAAPFYFRAHSGDCITFRHENRVAKDLRLDDFQVATPTDTIGQHIHLVKFDVLSSDGSANGWNYEDGTFAWEAVCERLNAADALARRTGGTSPPVPKYCEPGSTERRKYQATIQRWYADRTWIPDPQVEAQPATPQDASKRRQFDEVRAQTWCDQDGKQRWRFDGQVYSADCRDATLGTVFTHDHFGPSSIQQHGFYNALLIEPEFTRWFSADGRVMCSAADEMRGGQAQDGCLMPVTVLDLATDGPQFAVWRDIWRPNAQALILHDEGYRARNAARQVGSRQEPQFREFPLAIADFALLYDGRAGNDAASAEIGKQRERLQVTALRLLAEWRHQNGFPIEPPVAPEAISQHHHNPYLVNYAQDPVPLRIGASQSATENSPLASVSVAGGPADLRASCNWVSPSEQVSPSRQRSGEAGDLARAFDSFCHGDPFAEIFEAYEGETMQIRLIQGAQEVQHVFNLPSLRWQRDPNVSLGQSTGQEVAIRAQADQQRAVPNAAPTNRRESELRDQLYRDLLTSSLVSAQEVGISEHFEFYARGVDAVGRLGATDHFWHFGSADAIWNGAWGLVRVHNGTQGREFRQATLDATCITRAVEAAARGLPMPACFGDDPGAQRPTVRSRLLGMGAARYAMEQRAPENAMRWQRNEVRANTPRVNFLGWSLDRPAPMGQQWTDDRFRTPDETHGCPAWVAWYDPETTRWSWNPIKLRSYHVIAEPGGPPAREHNTGRIIDPRPIRFRAIGMWHSDWLGLSSVENPILNPPENAVYRPLAASPAEEHPLVIRARAGECIHIKLENLLPKDHFSPVPDGEARLPGITSINSVRYVPSEGLLRGANAVSLLPQLLHQTATLSGIRAGINAEAEEAKFRDKFAQVAEPGETVQYAWFAGRYITKPPELASPNGRSGYVVGFAEDYGPINLVSGTDPFVQTMHGLVGTLVIHEADAEIPEPSGQDQAGDWARSQIRVALKRYGLDRSYQDAVMAYRDGLNHHWQELSASAFPIPDCRTCGDSYDKGERAAGWGAEPFWARLHETQSLHETEPKLRLVPRRPQENDDLEDTESRWTDLNKAIFRQDFWLSPMPQTPLITAQRNVELRLHIGHPAGRARQRVFTILGHDYRDGRYTSVPSANNLTSGLPGIQARTCAPDPNLDVLGWYGSPGSSLLGPGRAITALILCPEAGEWLWRDGPANVFSSGVWGWLQVRP